MKLPVLYSFRRCPYAIRARMALLYSHNAVVLREVLLRDIPDQMRAVSPKATVPVLLMPNGEVIDESLQIMRWALQSNDRDTWINTEHLANCSRLLDENDGSFKSNLDRYKYADRYPDFGAEKYRGDAEVFIRKLELNLNDNRYFFGARLSLADVAIFPFIRQFAMVDKVWFDASPYPRLQRWLQYFLASDLFLSVMKKYPAWREGDEVTVFPSGR